jgi:predicted polyphosphate/ATP-dependent NAD kinase
MGEGTVGIIANPASGKDIRRLVAHGSTFDNNEKINIVRRVLLGLDAVGVSRVWFMPDTYAIVARAVAGVELRLEPEPLPMAVLNDPGDSYEAARRIVDLEAGAIVTLGGDGTNRVVAKGSGEVPLVPISTGTNNVFPRMVEGTLAGLAAGLIATGAVAAERGVRRLPRLDVVVDGQFRDLALIDVVTSGHAWVGARALWDPAHLREVVLSRVAAAEIGICGLGGLLFPECCGSARGVHIVIGRGERTVVTPIAPGLIRRIPIEAASLIAPGETVAMDAAPGTVALDGEREFELLGREQSLTVTLNDDGPCVVDIDATLRAGAEAGAFRAG